MALTALMPGRDIGALLEWIARSPELDTGRMSDRLYFRWTPLAGAQSYSVEVRDSTSDREVESDKLLKPEWTPTKPFERGHTYYWVVVATVGDGSRVYVPGAGSPSAVFAILPSNAFDMLEHAKAMSNGSHLLLAVLYSRQGLLPEARAQLKALKSENPNSALVARLERSLENRGGPRVSHAGPSR
jgi:hypothetical protein